MLGRRRQTRAPSPNRDACAPDGLIVMHSKLRSILEGIGDRLAERSRPNGSGCIIPYQLPLFSVFRPFPARPATCGQVGSHADFNDGSSSASSPTSGPHFLGPEPQQTFSTPSPTYPRSLPCRLNSIVAGIQIFNMHDTAAGC
ncbi:hypothetical protein ASPNIDRAFT_43098 [Aspergillus niger ATCC 1015]|uniref:Uncharacterized protein n=1 Tax=Aspergillus niger (strain ATCC 1015 / CBS 113.46 / FGSC A1144 / LSHB Ac4 / NCTC 3858a / NRRL 328 / USDA 3528.7) TaxID=380704 RepID=G3XLU0_ASPNA|nr:hypothetical protein ASPNIDRAFT_43098 [Aspergillus niger ATCC 1015]